MWRALLQKAVLYTATFVFMEPCFHEAVPHVTVPHVAVPHKAVLWVGPSSAPGQKIAKEIRGMLEGGIQLAAQGRLPSHTTSHWPRSHR